LGIYVDSLRIGCVKYLNARPLIRGWPGNVEFDHPSALCQRLASGQLDVALVSSFEFLRNPIYRIIDGVSISSDGPVHSVVVAHRGVFSDIEQIELDPASETAANLLRCLLAELKARLSGSIDLQSVCPAGLQSAGSGQMRSPAFRGFDKHADIQRTRRNLPAENISAGRTGRMPMFHPSNRARLIIGDQAIRFRQNHADAYQFWDLGEQWKKLTGLPFVYALWLIRPEVPDAKSIAQRLRVLRDENLADIPAIVSDAVADGADSKQVITQKFLDRYYREYLRFGFGTLEKQGLRTFADLCAKHGVLPKRGRDFSRV
jgi:chorismate dehydratase